MAKKRKPIKREIRCIYLALLKGNRSVLNLKNMIRFYEEYDGLRIRVMGSDDAPSTLKVSMPPLNMPRYLKWAKQYLIR